SSTACSSGGGASDQSSVVSTPAVGVATLSVSACVMPSVASVRSCAGNGSSSSGSGGAASVSSTCRESASATATSCGRAGVLTPAVDGRAATGAPFVLFDSPIRALTASASTPVSVSGNSSTSSSHAGTR